jgi:hypothetical protein
VERVFHDLEKLVKFIDLLVSKNVKRADRSIFWNLILDHIRKLLGKVYCQF